MLIDFNSGKGLFLQFVGLPTITQTHEHKTILSLFKKLECRSFSKKPIILC